MSWLFEVRARNLDEPTVKVAKTWMEFFSGCMHFSFFISLPELESLLCRVSRISR